MNAKEIEVQVLEKTTELIPAKEAKKSAIKKAVAFEEKLRKEMFEELPGRIRRNADRGSLKIEHYISFYMKDYSTKVEEVLKEVKAWLEDEKYGYKVTYSIFDYNGYYDKAKIIISWEEA